MDKVESGIYNYEGRDTTLVIFGGKIIIAGGSVKISGEEYRSLFLCEGEKNYGVGGKIKENYDEKMRQVQLLFNDEKSVDILIENLLILKDKLKKECYGQRKIR